MLPQALVESWGSRMWDAPPAGNPATGMLLWKAHNPWPALRSQLWDYYLEPLSGRAVARAPETPAPAPLTACAAPNSSSELSSPCT